MRRDPDGVLTSPAGLLRLCGIEKRFGGVHALRGVDFDLRAGEVHALLGENGAGKSTLMNVVSGVIAPDRGSVELDGRPVRFAGPRDAQAAGIATIFQELDLIPGLDVAANLFLGREATRFPGLLHTRSMALEAERLLTEAGISLDVGRRVASLGMGQRQLLAIAKALAHAPRVLVMDEPTAALSTTETRNLFDVMRGLCARGVGIIYISHRLEEVPQVADRVTVMRDGRVVGEERPDAPQGRLVQMLVGRPLAELFPPKTERVGEELLRLDRARYVPQANPAGWQAPMDMSLSVRAGEVVGLAGIVGAGRTELLSCLYGEGPRGRWHGTVQVQGRAAALRSVAEARRAGLAFVTDDRRGAGLMLRQTVARNVVASILRRLSPTGFMSRRREGEAVQRALRAFDIRPPRGDLVVGNLSGGNQQKVVFARELLHEPRLLLLDEPTRGVDVGAKGEIYARLRELTARGLGVLVASSELPELLGLCDRIHVLRAGRTVAQFTAGADEAELLAAATGERGLAMAQ